VTPPINRENLRDTLIATAIALYLNGCSAVGEPAVLPFGEIAVDHLGVTLPTPLVQLSVALDVCVGKVVEPRFSSLRLSLPARVSALSYSGPNFDNFFPGQENRQGRIGADRYSSRTSTDSAFPDEALRASRGDSQRETV
jgi:hypothetical protein